MKYRVARSTAIAAALGLGTAMAAAPALAQDYGQDYQAPAQQEAQVSETELNRFVDALAEISVIRETASVQLEAATDMEEAQQIQQDAQARMIEAVEDSGLSVEQYNQIATLMGSNQQLSERVHNMLEERS